MGRGVVACVARRVQGPGSTDGRWEGAREASGAVPRPVHRATPCRRMPNPARLIQVLVGVAKPVLAMHEIGNPLLGNSLQRRGRALCHGDLHGGRGAAPGSSLGLETCACLNAPAARPSGNSVPMARPSACTTPGTAWEGGGFRVRGSLPTTVLSLPQSAPPTSGCPVSLTRCSAFLVAMAVGTLPKMVVSPITSTSGLLNAARMAMLSSAGIGCPNPWSGFHPPNPRSPERNAPSRVLARPGPQHRIQGCSPIPGSVSMMSLRGAIAPGGVGKPSNALSGLVDPWRVWGKIWAARPDQSKPDRCSELG